MPSIQFTEAEFQTITRKLDAKLEADEISYRNNGQASVAYVEGWRIIAIANEVFGFNGWSSQILEHTVDFCDEPQVGKINVGVTCKVRVSLKDGTFHDDIGYGAAENQRAKAAALEKAKKEAVTDAVKRALRQFGDRLGNCTYDKVFLRDVKDGPPSVKPGATPAAHGSAVGAGGALRPQIRPPPVNAYRPAVAPALHNNSLDSDLCNVMMQQ